VSSSFPGPRNSVAQTPHNGVVPSEGTSCVMTPPERVGGYSVRKSTPPIPIRLTRVPSTTTHPGTAAAASMAGRLWKVRNPTTRYMAIEMNPRLYGNYLIDHECRLTSHLQSRCLPLLIDGRLSSSGAGRHEYQPPVMNERSMSSHLSHLNHPGPVSRSAPARVVLSDTDLAFIPHDGPHYLSAGKYLHTRAASWGWMARPPRCPPRGAFFSLATPAGQHSKVDWTERSEQRCT